MMKLNKADCPSSCRKRNDVDVTLDVKPPYFGIPSPSFFRCFCKKTCTAAKRLDMCRNRVYEKIRRPLENIDIPALLIFLKKNQDITHVNLACNSISDSGFINLIDHLLIYKNVYELDVQDNDITEIGTTYLLKVGEHLNIKSINLKANKFGVEASKNVAYFLLKNKHVEHLNVAEVDQTASSLIYFIMVLSSDQEEFNTTLKSLDISRPNPGCMYYFDSVHYASVIGHMLKHNTTLLKLHLQKYNFSCHDIEGMMSNAIYNNTLHLLDLGSNNIGDHGVDFLSNWLVKRPGLKTLILNRNIITDHGARRLSFALPFSKLLSLNISYNKITNDGMVEILNTLKKTPLLQELKIFGNCIGHPAAKIVKRMLVSGVLQQENIDVRPYRVDHRWYFARYQGTRCKEEHYDVQYALLPQVPHSLTRKAKGYYEYVYSKTSKLKMQYSRMTIISNILSKDHTKDCKCCYCLKCEEPHWDETCRNSDHPDVCTCCKCRGEESSDWSIDKSITDKVVTPRDPMKNISYILSRVNSETRENIVRWINIDENVLEEDLKDIADEKNLEESSSESTISCTCSWKQLSISSLQKYIERASSKNLLILPRNIYSKEHSQRH